jgi:fucose permease
MPGKTEEKSNAKPLGLIGTFKIKGVPHILLAFTAYCSAEATAMLWASSYLEVKIGLGKEMAAAFGSLFFIGMTVGRFLSGFIADRLGDRRLIRYGAYLSLVGIALIAVPVKVAAIIGFIVFGLGCAPIYPSVIHSIPATFGEEKSQGIIGVQMASAYFGSTFMPPLFGLIANHISISLMPLYLGAFVILMLVMISSCPVGRDKEATIH